MIYSLPFPLIRPLIHMFAGQLLSFCPGPSLPQMPVLALLPCFISFKLAPAMLFSLLVFAPTKRGFDSTNTRENNTKKSEHNSSGCLVSYGFVPCPLFPYSPFPSSLTHPQHLPFFPFCPLSSRPGQ